MCLSPSGVNDFLQTNKFGTHVSEMATEHNGIQTSVRTTKRPSILGWSRFYFNWERECERQDVSGKKNEGRDCHNQTYASVRMHIDRWWIWRSIGRLHSRLGEWSLARLHSMYVSRERESVNVCVCVCVCVWLCDCVQSDCASIEFWCMWVCHQYRSILFALFYAASMPHRSILGAFVCRFGSSSSASMNLYYSVVDPSPWKSVRAVPTVPFNSIAQSI